MNGRLTVCALIFLWFAAGGLAETRTYSPILPEGQVVPDIKALYVNTRSEINSVAISPDGKIIASGSNDGAVRLWDMGARKPIATFQGHTDIVNSVAFSPDGKTIASGSNDKTVRLWDMATGIEIKRLQGHTDIVNSVAFSPDGKTIASGSNDGAVRLWDMASGKSISTLPGHTGPIQSVAFSTVKDSKTLASGSRDGTIRIWDISSRKESKMLQGHTSWVNSVAFSPDEKTLTSGSADNTVRLWDIESGEEIKRLQGHTGTVYSVAFSPQGNTIASGSGDSTVRMWDFASGKEIKVLQGHTAPVRSVAFNSDGKILASGSNDSIVHLWDMASGKKIQMIQGHTAIVWSVAFSPGSKTIASGSDDKIVRLWDIASGKLTATFQGHKGSINSVAFGPGGKTVASGSDDTTVCLWDMVSGKEIQTLQGHSDAVLSVAFSPDGKTIASGSRDSTIRLWDADSGQLINILRGHTGPVTSVTFSPDGKTLATGSRDRTIRLWNIAWGKLQAELQSYTATVNSIAFSPDGKTIAAGSDDKIVHLLNIALGTETMRLEGHTGSVYSVAFSPDGKTIASGSVDKTIRLWDIISGKQVVTLLRHSDDVNSVAFSPDGNKLVFGSRDTTVCLWDISSGKPAVLPLGHTRPIVSVAFSPDGNILASGSWDTTVRLWDIASRKLLAVFNKHTFAVNCVAFSPDGKTLVSGSDDKTVRLWDIASKKEIKKLPEHTDSVFSVAFSPDGKFLASGVMDNTIRLWDIAFGNKNQALPGHTEGVNSVAFRSDGKTIACGSSDNTVRLWDIASGKEIQVLPGHTDSVYSVAFSPDGKTLASGSYDNTVRLWDIASGKSIATFHGHTDAVFSVAFSPDGKFLASGSGDNTIRLWDIALGKEIRMFLGHSSMVKSVAFNPDGKTIASGSDDGTVRIWNTAPLIRTCYGGYNNQWLSIDAGEKMYRYDDGAMLMKKNKTGFLTPIFPPISTQKGRLQVINKPSSLITTDGNTADFSLEIANKGKGRLYWVCISQDLDRDKSNQLNFHPPDTFIVLEPGQTKEMRCKVSILSEYENPRGQSAILYLRITALNDGRMEPVLLDIPIEQQTPAMELKNVWAEKQDKRVILATFQNTGAQALPQNTEITAQIGDIVLNKVTIDAVGAGERVDVPFAVPDGTEPDKKTSVSLSAATTTFPIHSWKFEKIPLTFPRSGWLLSLIILFSALMVGSPIAYYLRYYRHPLVVKLNRKPADMARLSPSELNLGHRLLSRTKRLHPLLENARIPRDNFNHSLLFYRGTTSPEARCRFLAKRWTSEFELVPHSHLPIFKIILPPDFILNIPDFLLALPSSSLSEPDIVNYLREVQGIKEKVCLILYPSVAPDSSLRELASSFDNLYVVPEVQGITELLLSPEPRETLARLIASQVKVTRISPYESGGGVTRESLFFGRAQIIAHIMQREPANYLLVGGRQLGKTSLLNALERRYKKDPFTQCDLVCLDSEKLPPMLMDISPAPEGKRRIILIDEADQFILAESRTGYSNLHRFRRISEEGWCKFILAGFWYLYRSASLDYHSPIRNFGELIPIEALEKDACHQLAETPMKNLAIHYESEAMMDRLTEQTGGRANLIAFTCNRMLRSLDMRKRELTPAMMEAAFDCDDMRANLGGWVNLTPDEPKANRLDRIIVYATIENNGTFTLKELLPLLDSLNCRAAAEDIKNSLTRLTLAFILKREKETYTYRVPLFTEMILQQGPKELLDNELKQARNEGE